MDLPTDVLARLGAKLDECDLAGDERAALVALLTRDEADPTAAGSDEEVAGFVMSVAANQADDMRVSVRFAELLPRLDTLGSKGGDLRYLPSSTEGTTTD